VLITTFNRDYPLIRFAPAISRRCCRTVRAAGPTCASRLDGVPTRAQGARDVRHPAQVNDVTRPSRGPPRPPGRRGRSGNDRMTLKCEARDRPAGLAEAIVASIRDVTKLRGKSSWFRGQLAKRRKVIEDQRNTVDLACGGHGQRVQPPHLLVSDHCGVARKAFRNSIESAPQTLASTTKLGTPNTPRAAASSVLRRSDLSFQTAFPSARRDRCTAAKIF